MQAPLTALLYCNDAQTLQVIDRTFEQYSVSTYFCMSGQSAQISASQRKFDMLMLDFDEAGARELIDYRATDLWGYPSVVIAIANDPAILKRLLTKRVHFTLQKPFTPELMSKTLKASYSMIVNEKRTAFRHSVRMEANASYLEHHTRRPVQNAIVQDLSTTGLCLQSDTVVEKDSIVFVEFELPEMDTLVSVIGKVMWSDPNGRAGVQFRFVPPIEQKHLREWLSLRCPWESELMPRAFGQHDLNAAAVPTRIQ